MQKTEDGFVLSTGKKFYAYGGILGVSKDFYEGANFYLHYGYDGTVEVKLTRKEKAEIADYMIQLWHEYKCDD